MTDQHAVRDTDLTTEHIALDGAGEATEPPSSHVERGRGIEAAHAESRTQLLEGEELQGVITRWREIQAHFVDEPRSAVQQADALVADLMQRLARMFAAERDQLESRWTSGEDVSTEDLRQGLQRYRTFFERLLAA